MFLTSNTISSRSEDKKQHSDQQNEQPHQQFHHQRHNSNLATHIKSNENMSTDKVCYPSSSTTPFPYTSGPYPQQAALMDAIFQSLQQIDDDDIGSSTTTNYQDQQKLHHRKQQMNVMMLESPTGTGKSLSLACAALAWLRFRERLDLKNIVSSSVSSVLSTKDGENTAPANGSTKDDMTPPALDWLDAWSPPEEVAKEERIAKQQVECQEKAKSSRHALEVELNFIRNQLTKYTAAHMSRGKAARVDGVINDGDGDSDRKIMKRVRGTLARKGVDAAKVTERQKRRKKTRSNNADTGTRRNAGTVKKKHGNTWKEVNSITTTIDHEKSSSLDFCLEEYKSDDENYPHRKKGTNSTPSFDDEYGDDNDCQDNSNSALVVAGEHNDRRQNMMQNNSEDKNNITSFTVPPVNILSARDLIDGGRLDGSGISRERANQLRHGGSKQPSNRHTSSSTSAHSAVNAKTDDDDDMVMPSIGGVTAGTGVRKIIYAARTHSQLSQFVGEVHRAAAAVTEKDIGVRRTNSRVGEIGKRGGRAVRVVALGGRKLLCSNQDVIFGRGRRTNQQRRSEAMITEKCLDLQKGISSSPSSAIVGTTLHDLNNSPTSIIAENGGRGVVQVKRHGEQSKRKRKNKISCPLLASKEATSTLALHMLAKPSDIEDLAGLGDASTTCAYYASREALAAAEVVVVPYNTLLSSHSRQAVGLNLHQCLVIIDEAHNIPEALRSLSSCRLTLSAIQGADSQLSNYIQKYASRLAGKNLFYLGQIRRFLMSTTRYLTNAKPRTASNKSSSSKSSMVVTATELLFTLKLDNLNIFNVLRYLQKSRLAQKLHGFTSSTINADNDKNNDGTKEDGNHDLVSKHISAMSIVQEFLTFLTGSQRDGRVVIEWPAQAQTPTKNGAKHQSRSSYPVYPSFRYLLLNPASQFQNVVDEAHAVILIGGTIRPFSHMAAELFGSTNAKLVVQATTAEMKCTLQPPGSSFVSITPSLTTFKCGHVVPPSHVFTTRLSSGPTGVKLDFRHSSRSLHTVCDELGRSILNMCRVVPAGFVVFLPSYSYEGHLMARWNQTGLLQKLQKTKKLYREPKSSRDVEATLQLYSNNARLSKNGAILFCVIGGKMSEGINFANDMARCVFIVGLPYPDITDAELQEKMRLLDIDFQQKKIQISGQKYYHNLCMRAVNQSIGRAIRHAKDYAAIVLADARYASESKIWLALPEWIRSGGGMENSLQLPLSFGEKVTKIEAFFRDRSRNE